MDNFEADLVKAKGALSWALDLVERIEKQYKEKKEASK